MNRIQSLRLSILGLALAPVAVSVAGGALEINQDCAAVGCFAGDTAGFPITISTPGSYVLTSDIAVTTAGAVGIAINASPVDLNLNGHTIDGGGSCSGSPVTTCTVGAGETGITQNNSFLPGTVHVHDGTIRGFTHDGLSAGMYFNDSGDGIVLEHLNVMENAGGWAIAFSAAPSVTGMVRLRDSLIARNQNIGVAQTGGAVTLTISIENSEISSNGSYGVLSPPSATYVGNRFFRNGNNAINCGGACALGSNTFAGNNLAGIQYSVSTLRDMGGNVCLDHSCP